MSSQDLYTLSWGEFRRSLTATAQELRDSHEMVDVTLAADGKVFPAHKLVLSAASPFLMKLIKSTPCHHPVVMLAGVTALDLEALLQFVYQGEVSVDPTQLPSLLQAAQCLDIQALTANSVQLMGLLDNSTETSSHTPREHTISHVTTHQLTPQRRKRKQQPLSGSPKLKRRKSENIGEEHSSDSQIQGANESETITDAQCDGEQALTITLGEGKLRPASEQPCMCSYCGMMIRQARNLRRHMMGCPCRPIPNVECTPQLTLPFEHNLNRISDASTQSEISELNSGGPTEIAPLASSLVEPTLTQSIACNFANKFSGFSTPENKHKSDNPKNTFSASTSDRRKKSRKNNEGYSNSPNTRLRALTTQNT